MNKIGNIKKILEELDKESKIVLLCIVKVKDRIIFYYVE